jgi:ATP-binding protein involved in chromosome partitioning
MSLGFLVESDQAVIWRGPMVHSLIQQFLRDVDWGELDYLIVDLPPGTGDAQLTLTQSIPLAGAVVVTTPQAMASSIAGKVVSLFRKMNVHVLGAIENMGYFICDECGKEHEIFDRGGGERMAKHLEIPFLGTIPLDPRMRSADDAGTPVVESQPESKVAQVFREVAEKLAQQVAIANATLGNAG